MVLESGLFFDEKSINDKYIGIDKSLTEDRTVKTLMRYVCPFCNSKNLKFNVVTLNDAECVDCAGYGDERKFRVFYN